MSLDAKLRDVRRRCLFLAIPGVVLLAMSACQSSNPMGQHYKTFMRPDGIKVECPEAREDVITKEAKVSAELTVKKIGTILKGSAGAEITPERIRQEVPQDVSTFELLDSRICFQYGNGVITPEEYRTYTQQILPILRERTGPDKQTKVPPPPKLPLIVEGVNDPFTVLPQENQPLPPKIAKFARIRVSNIGRTRVSNVEVVVIKVNGRDSRFQLPVASIDTLFERQSYPRPQGSVDLSPGADQYFDAVVECNGKTCTKGQLAIPYIESGSLFVVSPIEKGVARLDEFTVRVSGDTEGAVTQTFVVSRGIDGYLVLKEKPDKS